MQAYQYVTYCTIYTQYYPVTSNNWEPDLRIKYLYQNITLKWLVGTFQTWISTGKKALNRLIQSCVLLVPRLYANGIINSDIERGSF